MFRNLTVGSLTTNHAEGKICHGTTMSTKPKLMRKLKHNLKHPGSLEDVMKANYQRRFQSPRAS